MTYTAPTEDISFALERLSGLADLVKDGAFETYDDDLIEPILEEAGKLASEVLAPLNQSGDKTGAQLTEDGVKAAPGFAEAFNCLLYTSDAADD